MRTLEGKFNGKGLRIGIVAGRFNEFITSKLVGGAVDVLKRNDVNDEDIDIAWVPGAFEIPLITKKMAESKKYDAIITLGAVIKGSTPHFDYVCAEVSKGVAQISLQTGLPIMFGVLTTNNIEEAIEIVNSWKMECKMIMCALNTKKISELKNVKYVLYGKTLEFAIQQK